MDVPISNVEKVEDFPYTFSEAILLLPFYAVPSPILPISINAHLINAINNGYDLTKTCSSNSLRLVLLILILLKVSLWVFSTYVFSAC